MQYPTFLKRPEVLAFLVATAIHLLSRIPAVQSGEFILPTQSIEIAVGVAWAVFVGFVFEGQFKPEAYAASLKTLWQSKKFQTLWLSIVALVINAFLEPSGLSLPENVIGDLGGLLLLLPAGKGLVDGLRMQPGPEIKLSADVKVDPKFLGRP